MKKVVFIFMLSLLTIFSFSSNSFAEEMVLKSPDVILSEIMGEQGINDPTQIDPGKVSQAKLEELGDSAMEAMIGNTAMHEQMDTRLGGEGSESLKAFHINVGLNYLSDYPNGMMNLMSGGMMSNNYSSSAPGWSWENMMNNNNSSTNSGWYGNGMMNSFAFAGVAVGIIVIFLIIIIGVIIFAVVRSKKTPVAQEKSLEILGIRYANGEITKEEFDNMTKNIRSLK